jgi:hypothetical protein
MERTEQEIIFRVVDSYYGTWLAGIEVQFDLFEGGAKRARLSHE